MKDCREANDLQQKGRDRLPCGGTEWDGQTIDLKEKTGGAKTSALKTSAQMICNRFAVSSRFPQMICNNGAQATRAFERLLSIENKEKTA